ncbi:MAG: hypothetical protein ACPGVN_00095 [Alphaproteobacteria bacterium]
MRFESIRPKSLALLHRSLGVILLIGCLVTLSVFPSQRVIAAGSVVVKKEKLPFWPAFPKELQVKPTGVQAQHQAGIMAGLRVTGEGPGFVVIANSNKSMIFAAPPRLAPAWQVECEIISCDVRRIAGEVGHAAHGDETKEEKSGRAAYHAALKFVTLYTGFNEDMKSQQIQREILPPISDLKSNVSRPLVENDQPQKVTKVFFGNSLLQGFQ